MGICISSNYNSRITSSIENDNEFNNLKPYAKQYGFENPEYLRRKIHASHAADTNSYGSDKALRDMRTDAKLDRLKNEVSSYDRANNYNSYSCSRLDT